MFKTVALIAVFSTSLLCHLHETGVTNRPDATEAVAVRGCCGSDDSAPRAAPAVAAFESLKKLAGNWVQLDEEGKPTDVVGTSFRLTAGGTAIVETLFPGAPQEMMTVYYVDGDKLVLTHYCMMGNQPHMELQADSTEKKLVFEAVGGGNLKDMSKMHMHKGTLTIVGDDRIDAEWLAMNEGKLEDHGARFRLQRKK